MVKKSVGKKEVEIPFVKNQDGSASFFMNLATGSSHCVEQAAWDVAMRDIVMTHPMSDLEYKRKIQKAIFYYHNDPMVYQCISMLSQLSNDSFKISSEDAEMEIILNRWWRDVEGDSFLQAFFLEFFRSGNVPILRTLVPYVPKGATTDQRLLATASEAVEAREEEVETDEMKKATATGLKKKLDRVLNSSIPSGYTILNPLQVNVKNMLSTSIHSLSVDPIMASFLKQNGSEALFGMFPPEVETRVLNGDIIIPLPEHIFTMIHKEKQPYELWALPTVSHCFDALDFKNELREMDKTTVRGVKNRILQVTIGSDMFPVTDNTQLKELAKMFQNPSKNLTIFWNHTLNIKYIEPTMDTLTSEKYVPVNNEILSCFGVAPALLGEGTGSTGNNVLNMKGLIEKLDHAQTAFCSWFRGELEMICRVMGKVDASPELGFGKLNLKDENAFIGVVMQMVDRQIISYETATETVGFYFPKELDRLKKEKKIRDTDEILVAQVAPTQQGAGDGKTPMKPGTSGRPKSAIPEGKRPASTGKPKSPAKTKSISSEQFIEMCKSGGYSIATSKKDTATVSEILKSLIAEKIEDERERTIGMVRVISTASEIKNFTGEKDSMKAIAMAIDGLFMEEIEI